MFNDESQWKRGAFLNIAFGVVGAALFLADLIWSPSTNTTLRGAGLGLVGASVALYFGLYRQANKKLTSTERESLIELESQSNLQLFTGMLALAVCVAGLVVFQDNDTAFVAIALMTAVTVLFIGYAAFRSLKTTRQSRTDPSLNDERAQARYQQANAKAFTYTLNTALIGGAIHIIGGIDIPVWVAIYTPVYVGILAMLWVLSRDDTTA